jgi:hypothetical protein
MAIPRWRSGAESSAAELVADDASRNSVRQPENRMKGARKTTSRSKRRGIRNAKPKRVHTSTWVAKSAKAPKRG